MLSDDNRSSLCPFSLNDGALEASQRAGSNDKLCWKGGELYALLKRTFLVIKRTTCPFQNDKSFLKGDVLFKRIFSSPIWVNDGAFEPSQLA